MATAKKLAIELTAETEGVKKGLQQAKKAVEDNTKNLTKEQQKQADKIEKIKKDLVDKEEKYIKEKTTEYVNALDKELKAVKKNTKEEYEIKKKYLDKISKLQKDSAKPSISEPIGGGKGGVVTGGGGIGGAIGGIENVMSKIPPQAAAVAGAIVAIGAGAQQATEAFNEYNNALAKFQVTAKLTGSEANAIGNELLKIPRPAEMSSSALMEIASTVSTFVKSSDDIPNVTSDIIKLSQAYPDVNPIEITAGYQRLTAQLGDSDKAFNVLASSAAMLRGKSIDPLGEAATEISTVFTKASVAIKDTDVAMNRAQQVFNAFVSNGYEVGEATSTAEAIFEDLKNTLQDTAAVDKMKTALASTGLSLSEVGLEVDNVDPGKLIDFMQSGSEGSKQLTLALGTSGERLQLLQSALDKSGSSMNDFVVQTANVRNELASMVSQQEQAANQLNSNYNNLLVNIGSQLSGVQTGLTSFFADVIGGIASWFEPLSTTIDSAIEKATQFTDTANELQYVLANPSNNTKDQLDAIAKMLPQISEVSEFAAGEIETVLNNTSIATEEKLAQIQGLLKGTIDLAEQMSDVETFKSMDASGQQMFDNLYKNITMSEHMFGGWSAGDALKNSFEWLSRTGIPEGTEKLKSLRAELDTLPQGSDQYGAKLKELQSYASEHEENVKRWKGMQDALTTSIGNTINEQKLLNDGTLDGLSSQEIYNEVLRKSPPELAKSVEFQDKLRELTYKQFQASAETNMSQKSYIQYLQQEVSIAQEASALTGTKLSNEAQILKSKLENLTATQGETQATIEQINATGQIAGLEEQNKEQKIETLDATRKQIEVEKEAAKQKLIGLQKTLEGEAAENELLGYGVNLANTFGKALGLGEVAMAGVQSKTQVAIENIKKSIAQMDQALGTVDSEVKQISSDTQTAVAGIEKVSVESAEKLIQLRQKAGDITAIQAQKDMLALYQNELNTLMKSGIASEEKMLELRLKIKDAQDGIVKAQTDEFSQTEKMIKLRQQAGVISEGDAQSQLKGLYSQQLAQAQQGGDEETILNLKIAMKGLEKTTNSLTDSVKESVNFNDMVLQSYEYEIPARESLLDKINKEMELLDKKEQAEEEYQKRLKEFNDSIQNIIKEADNARQDVLKQVVSGFEDPVKALIGSFVELGEITQQTVEALQTQKDEINAQIDDTSKFKVQALQKIAQTEEILTKLQRQLSSAEEQRDYIVDVKFSELMAKPENQKKLDEIAQKFGVGTDAYTETLNDFNVFVENMAKQQASSELSQYESNMSSIESDIQKAQEQLKSFQDSIIQYESTLEELAEKEYLIELQIKGEDVSQTVNLSIEDRLAALRSVYDQEQVIANLRSQFIQELNAEEKAYLERSLSMQEQQYQKLRTALQNAGVDVKNIANIAKEDFANLELAPEVEKLIASYNRLLTDQAGLGGIAKEYDKINTAQRNINALTDQYGNELYTNTDAVNAVSNSYTSQEIALQRILAMKQASLQNDELTVDEANILNDEIKTLETRLQEVTDEKTEFEITVDDKQIEKLKQDAERLQDLFSSVKNSLNSLSDPSLSGGFEAMFSNLDGFINNVTTGNIEATIAGATQMATGLINVIQSIPDAMAKFEETANEFGMGAAVTAAAGDIMSAIGNALLMSGIPYLQVAGAILLLGGSVANIISGALSEQNESELKLFDYAEKYKQQQESISKEFENQINILESQIKLGIKRAQTAKEELENLKQIRRETLGLNQDRKDLLDLSNEELLAEKQITETKMNSLTYVQSQVKLLQESNQGGFESLEIANQLRAMGLLGRNESIETASTQEKILKLIEDQLSKTDTYLDMLDDETTYREQQVDLLEQVNQELQSSLDLEQKLAIARGDYSNALAASEESVEKTRVSVQVAMEDTFGEDYQNFVSEQVSLLPIDAMVAEGANIVDRIMADFINSLTDEQIQSMDEGTRKLVDQYMSKLETVGDAEFEQAMKMVDLRKDAGLLTEMEAEQQKLTLIQNEYNRLVLSGYATEEELLTVQAQRIQQQEKINELQSENNVDLDEEFAKQENLIKLRRDAGEITEEQANDQLLDLYNTELERLISMNAAEEDILGIKIKIRDIEEEINDELGEQDKTQTRLAKLVRERQKMMDQLRSGTATPSQVQSVTDKIRLELKDQGLSDDEINRFISTLPQRETGGPIGEGLYYTHDDEFVMKKEAVQKYGQNLLSKMNNLDVSLPDSDILKSLTRDIMQMNSSQNIVINVQVANDWQVGNNGTANQIATQQKEMLYDAINQGIKSRKINLINGGRV